MRIVLFDTLLERHVVASLGRALSQRGHEVLSTGTIWHGSSYPSDEADVAKVERALGEVLADPPDALLNFRTAALVPEQVERLRAAGVVTAAWFSDDPVLWASTTGRVAGCYDVLLHAGGERVLAHYEAEHGRSGVTFPFWTDSVVFPYSYDPDRAEVDVVFLGHAITGVRRWRYDWLAEAAQRVDLVMYGSTPEDPAGICRGWVRKDHDVLRALAGARMGLNISQRFADYAGSDFDFPGLAAMGEFPVPSRVVQFAAVGLPVVTLRTEATDAGTIWDGMFPEAVAVETAGELATVVSAAKARPGALREWSLETHERFLRDFTAGARAALLEDLLDDPFAVDRLDRRSRARLYAGYRRQARRAPLARRAADLRRRAAAAVGEVTGRPFTGLPQGGRSPWHSHMRWRQGWRRRDR